MFTLESLQVGADDDHNSGIRSQPTNFARCFSYEIWIIQGTARHAVVRLYAKNNGPHTTSFSVSLIFHLEHLVLLGKLIGGFCALSGVFILTLPIPIVVNSFAQFYKNRLWRNEVTNTFLIISILVRGIIIAIIVSTTTSGRA